MSTTLVDAAVSNGSKHILMDLTPNQFIWNRLKTVFMISRIIPTSNTDQELLSSGNGCDLINALLLFVKFYGFFNVFVHVGLFSSSIYPDAFMKKAKN